MNGASQMFRDPFDFGRLMP